MTDPEHVTAAEVVDLTLKAFYRRLRTSPDEVPAHALAQILKTAEKLQERDRSAGGDEDAEERLSLFERLESLPPERQAELLIGRARQLREDLQNVEERLAALPVAAS